MEELKRRLLLKFGDDPILRRRLEILCSELDEEEETEHQALLVNNCQGLCSHALREVVLWTIPIPYS
jgi:hypothetical protein